MNLHDLHAVHGITTTGKAVSLYLGHDAAAARKAFESAGSDHHEVGYLAHGALVQTRNPAEEASAIKAREGKSARDAEAATAKARKEAEDKLATARKAMAEANEILNPKKK